MHRYSWVRNSTGKQLIHLSDAPQQALSCKAITVLGLFGASCQGMPKRREKNVGCEGFRRLQLEEAGLCLPTSFISPPGNYDNNKATEDMKFTAHRLL